MERKRIVARKREILERKLKRIERIERGLQSFLVPGPVYDSDSDADTEIISSDAEDDTPQKEYRTSIKDLFTINSLRKAATISDPSTLSNTLSNRQRFNSAQRLIAAKTWPSIPERIDEDITSDKESSIGFNISAGTSTADGLSIRNTTHSSFEEPTVPVRDPSTYFVWLDLEVSNAQRSEINVYNIFFPKTNDATRPTRNIRILEIAVCITDKNYVKLDEGISYLVHWPLTAAEIAVDMSPL